jgi:hypothetical protein
MLFLFTNAVRLHAGAAAGALATVETSRWIEGWNAHDARALGELLTDDVDFVLVNGTLVHGRPASRTSMLKSLPADIGTACFGTTA